MYFTLCIFEFLWTCICLYISVLFKLIFITFIDLLLSQKLALFSGWTEKRSNDTSLTSATPNKRIFEIKLYTSGCYVIAL